LLRELNTDLSKLTGFERVCAYPSASDALAAAVRVARRASGQELIALISGSSLGSHDVALTGAAQLTLTFGAESTLQTLAAHASKLAGIVIDPVQLDVEPRTVKSFIEQCRAIASQSKCLLIIDETFTALRIAQGSAQAFLGVKGDLAVYAGAMAEGLPFAALAGDAAAMDGHQDTSTSLHSLVLARAHAMLRSFGESTAARAALETRAARFVDKLNRMLRAVRAPLRAQRFSSLYSVVVTQREPFGQLFHSYVRERGLTSHHDSLAMLTTAHTDEILDQMLSLYRDAAAAMRRDGLIGRVDAPVQMGVDENVERTDWYLPPCEGAKLGYDSAGNPVWFAAQSGNAVQVVE
jgi:microcystin synthetase protein McyE